MIEQDEYGCVLSRPETYKGIAQLLCPTTGTVNHSVIFAWTDEAGSQLDILMTYKPIQYGTLQRGMNARTDLFVAVSGHGFFGFVINDIWKHPGYVGEKLQLGGENATTIPLAELINGVIKELCNA